MHKYKLICKKGEGTFSEVLKAQCVKNGKLVAIKRMKARFKSVEQVNNLREIQALRRLSSHPAVVKLYEVVFERSSGRLALVFELLDMNVYELIRGRRHYLPIIQVKAVAYYLLLAIDYMHLQGIFHRDIKPENILLSEADRSDNKIGGLHVRVADFGSCRGIYTKAPFTEYISTRWYRAPECCLTDGYYNHKMDIWGCGCVLFEILALYPLFPGTNEVDQVNKIHTILGTPPPELLARMKMHSTSNHIDFNFPRQEGCGLAKLLPNGSPELIDLLEKLMTYNPDERISAKQALRHPWFKDIREAERARERGVQPRSRGPKIPQIPAQGSSTDEDKKKHRSKKEEPSTNVSDSKKSPGNKYQQQYKRSGGNGNSHLPQLNRSGAGATQTKKPHQSPRSHGKQQPGSGNNFHGQHPHYRQYQSGSKVGGSTGSHKSYGSSSKPDPNALLPVIGRSGGQGKSYGGKNSLSQYSLPGVKKR